MKNQILGFEWYNIKNEINLKKHGVCFEEATIVFDDNLALYKQDFEHSFCEERSYIIGQSSKNKLLVVSFSERGDNIRIISARCATKNERKFYES